MADEVKPLDEGNDAPYFNGGIAEKAQELRDNGIDPGDPLEQEAYFPDGSHSLQFTTTGVFMYSNAGKVHFFEGV